MMLANFQVTDYDGAGRPTSDAALLSVPLSDVLTQELDGASEALGVTAEDILLAALGRAIGRTIGEGVVAIDVPGHGRAVYPVALSCMGPNRIDATEMLASVHYLVATVAQHRTVHGVPDHPVVQPRSDVMFAYGASGPADLGHALELRAHRRGGILVLDWWYDASRFEPYTIEELAEQFPFALIELTSEATAPVLGAAELAMAH